MKITPDELKAIPCPRCWRKRLGFLCDDNKTPRAIRCSGADQGTCDYQSDDRDDALLKANAAAKAFPFYVDLKAKPGRDLNKVIDRARADGGTVIAAPPPTAPARARAYFAKKETTERFAQVADEHKDVDQALPGWTIRKRR
ncbi:MAG TPA: hypothetical protein VH374_01555 [Polyangia bacterium]|jgi:hypothetical protein|nr:hypothetical protein [Polyangia bacterium]